MALFHKEKTRNADQTVTLLDFSGHQLFQGSVYSLPIREEVIRLKSVEFFQDPEPCTIHRNAVYFRLCTEVEHYINKCGQNTILLDSMPEKLQCYLDIHQGVIHVV